MGGAFFREARFLISQAPHSLSNPIAMDTGAMYRNGSSVSFGIGDSFPSSTPMQVTPPNFYTRGPTLSSPALQQNCGPVNADSHVANKLDQLMNMVSSTQHLIMNQEKTCQSLQSEIMKLSSDMSELKEEVAEMKEDRATLQVEDKASSGKNRIKVPAELSVSCQYC